MIDIDVIDNTRVSYVEPNSLVHKILMYIASQKIMKILGSGNEGEDDAMHQLGKRDGGILLIKYDPECVLERSICQELNIDPKGLKWLYSTGVLKEEFSMIDMPTNYTCRYEKFARITNYGETILSELEKNLEVELYLD